MIYNEVGMVEVSFILLTPQLWALVILIAAGGGLSSHFINQESRLQIPRRDPEDTRKIVLGPIADITVGIVAAIASLWFFNPQTEYQLFGMTAIASYGGGSILQAFVNRMMAGIAEKKATQLDNTINELKKTETALDVLKAEEETIKDIKRIKDLIE